MKLVVYNNQDKLIGEYDTIRSFLDHYPSFTRAQVGYTLSKPISFRYLGLGLYLYRFREKEETKRSGVIWRKVLGGMYVINNVGEYRRRGSLVSHRLGCRLGRNQCLSSRLVFETFKKRKVKRFHKLVYRDGDSTNLCYNNLKEVASSKGVKIKVLDRKRGDIKRFSTALEASLYYNVPVSIFYNRKRYFGDEMTASLYLLEEDVDVFAFYKESDLKPRYKILYKI